MIPSLNTICAIGRQIMKRWVKALPCIWMRCRSCTRYCRIASRSKYVEKGSWDEALLRWQGPFLWQCRSCTLLGHFIYENGMCCRLVFFVVKFSLEIQRQSLGQGEIPYRRYSPRACMVIVIKPDDKELSLQPGHDLV